MPKCGKSIYDKLWEEHAIKQFDDGSTLLYIDRHLIHEVTTPQAFEGLRLKGRQVRRPESIMATIDHNVSTKPENRYSNAADDLSQKQIEALEKNCKEFGISLFDLQSPEVGIVHVVAPEQGVTLPGLSIVCGDSHTSTHGAFGSLAFGIGTSEIEHVFATQTLRVKKSKKLLIKVNGKLQNNVSAKDLALYIIGKIGASGGAGYAIEYVGETIEALSMEGRMTLCNMAIEAGSKTALINPDETTFKYLKDKKYAPKQEMWEQAKQYWLSLRSDTNAHYDKVITIDASKIAPQVTWGTSPDQVISIDETIPHVDEIQTPSQVVAYEKALVYTKLQPGMSPKDFPLDYIFIGSCTNSRLEDLRLAAKMVEGYQVSQGITAIVVPGSMPVKLKAEEEGLDIIFKNAGFEWREPGCSLCLGMNDDILLHGEYCASTSNRNFEGRQGKGAKTFLVSPQMAAVAAIKGHFTDIRKWEGLK